jgi:hypothetical protein
VLWSGRSEGSERKNGGRRACVCKGAYMHSGTTISKNGTPVTQYHRGKSQIGRIGMLGNDGEWSRSR